jgi:hypothetical protein
VLLRWLLTPIVWLLDILLIALVALIVVVGAMRFFLSAGGSPRFIARRKKWIEGTVLGRPMGPQDFTQFSAWHAETAARRLWRWRE